ncbi:MAG: PHP domain-containing protein [Dehalococcoidia bacterium]
MATGDFHLHSTASDGVHSPTWVMETAAKNGVRALSLTDHDTTEGLEEARRAADRLGLRLIPGMEISTDVGKVDAHLLAYGFNVEAKELQDFMQSMRDGRKQRLTTMVRILRDHAMPIEESRVLEIAGEASVGRPHVARALVEKGYVASVQEAFDLWLGNGKPADVNRERLEPADSIDLVHRHGGVISIAHPIFMGDDYSIPVANLVDWGADGIETYYKNYSPEAVRYHEELAEKHGLIRSGGSDYHGLGNPDDREIGDFEFPEERVAEFLKFLDDNCFDAGNKKR